MSDFATINTSRYKVRYSSQGKSHDLVLRYREETLPPDSEFINGVSDFLTAIKAVRNADWTVLGCEYAIRGNAFFLPWIPVAPEAGEGTATNGGKPVNINFQGLSSLANRASLYVYGVIFDPVTAAATLANDYRILPAEHAAVDAGLVALAAITDLVAIDREGIFWHQYANVNVNAYYQRKARG